MLLGKGTCALFLSTAIRISSSPLNFWPKTPSEYTQRGFFLFWAQKMHRGPILTPCGATFPVDGPFSFCLQGLLRFKDHEHISRLQYCITIRYYFTFAPLDQKDQAFIGELVNCVSGAFPAWLHGFFH